MNEKANKITVGKIIYSNYRYISHKFRNNIYFKVEK